MHIALVTPVRQKAQMTEMMLASHRNLTGLAARYYYPDGDEGSDALLRAEMEKTGVSIIPPLDLGPSSYQADGKTHVWTDVSVDRVAKIRNHCVDTALRDPYDALFLVDADVLLHPETVSHLQTLEKSIVSEVFWTQWESGYPWMPQVWDFHPYGFKEPHSVLRLREAGTYRVSGLGACTLIRRRVFDAGVHYGAIPSLARIVLGEDRYFCIRAEAHGFELWADTNFPGFHIYRDSLVGEAQKWASDGCHPGYFRKYWLTAQWEKSVLRTAKE
jgi:hypothetical protein